MEGVSLGQVNTEVYIMVIVFFAGMFAFLRYVSSSNQKREEALMRFVNEQAAQTQLVVDKQLDYNKNKNDHMERMSDNFAATIKEVSVEMAVNTAQIANVTDDYKHLLLLTRSSLDNNTRQTQKLYEKLVHEHKIINKTPTNA